MHVLNFFTLAGVTYYLQTYGYLVMFVLMVVEGPIVTYISAFAASQGLFNVYWVFTLSVVGNLISDITFFWVGRKGRGKNFLNKEGRLSMTLDRILSHLDQHPGKSIAIIKIVPGIPIPGVILTGKSKIKFSKFVFYALLVGIPYALFFTALGYYSGLTFSQFAKYMRIEEIVLLVLFVLFFFFKLNKISPKIANKLEKDLDKKNS